MPRVNDRVSCGHSPARRIPPFVDEHPLQTSHAARRTDGESGTESMTESGAVSRAIRALAPVQPLGRNARAMNFRHELARARRRRKSRVDVADFQALSLSTSTEIYSHR